MDDSVYSPLARALMDPWTRDTAVTATVVASVLAAGADPTRCPATGIPHLWTAIMYHQPKDIVYMLLDAGADPFTSVQRIPLVQRPHTGILHDLFHARERHQLVFPALEKDLMEYVWHPARLARQNYFRVDVVCTTSSSLLP